MKTILRFVTVMMWDSQMTQKTLAHCFAKFTPKFPLRICIDVRCSVFELEYFGFIMCMNLAKRLAPEYVIELLLIVILSIYFLYIQT